MLDTQRIALMVLSAIGVTSLFLPWISVDSLLITYNANAFGIGLVSAIGLIFFSIIAIIGFAGGSNTSLPFGYYREENRVSLIMIVVSMGLVVLGLYVMLFGVANHVISATAAIGIELAHSDISISERLEMLGGGIALFTLAGLGVFIVLLYGDYFTTLPLDSIGREIVHCQSCETKMDKRATFCPNCQIRILA